MTRAPSPSVDRVRPATPRSVALVTLGCARNEVDSEELAGRLADEGWTLVGDAAEADVVVVNTCGFVEQAKKDSIDALLEAADLKEQGRTHAVVAVGCLAQRYGEQLASQLPEADAVLGFDSYTDMSAHLTAVLAGEHLPSHVPSDRRRVLPLSPVARQGGAEHVVVPGHGAAAQQPVAVDLEGPVPAHLERLRRPGAGSGVVRARLDERPWAPLKIASGCDRRCAFCAIPMFRGAFVSRRPHDVLAEARWLGERGVRELFLVSENSTSYGKDLGDLRLLETMLPELAGVDGIERVRVSYLQPAEVRPDLLDVMAGTPGVVPYFDLSFQHASAPLLRRMRRFGSRESFLALIGQVRERAPLAGIRSNVIVGFPGETEADFAQTLELVRAARFAARLGLVPNPELIGAMSDLRERLRIVSAERIRDEFSKLLLTDRPRVGLDLLVRTELADIFLPEVPALRLERDEHHRHKDVYTHSLTVLEQAIDLEKARNHQPDLINRLAALLHDIGKPRTRRFEAGGKVTFHHHDVVGAKLARKRLKALRYSTDEISAVAKLIELHLRFHGYSDGEGGWTDSAVRRYVRDAGDQLERLHMLTRADCTTRNQAKATKLRRAYDELEWRIDELAQQEELDAMRPDLDGNQIMQILDIPPGRVVGEAYKHLLELRIDNGPLGEERATQELRSWWASRPPDSGS